MADDAIAGEEVLFRRIPPTQPPDPPHRITSAHFKLRKDEQGVYEEGLSVYRQRIVKAEDVLQKPGAIPGSFVVQATAGAIRGLKDGNGKPLDLDVVAVSDQSDPGHAEIRGPVPRKLSQSASRALKKLFKQG